MAHDEPPHQDLRCSQIQLFLSLVLKELRLVFLSVVYNQLKRCLVRSILACEFIQSVNFEESIKLIRHDTDTKTAPLSRLKLKQLIIKISITKY